jgi:hypothetical protein
MKFTKVKHSILKKQFKKALREDEKRRVVSQKEIYSVGILTTEDIASKMEVQQPIETILGLRSSKMYAFRKEPTAEEISYKYFSEEDINWKGEALASSFASFLEQPFDLLIGFYATNNLYLEHATLQSKATFKVGFSKVNSSLFEIEISENIANITGFCEELKKYLVLLKKLKN